MYLKVACCRCRNNERIIFELRDDHIHRITCKFGHETDVVVQQLKYELLFDFGVMALIDGYAREAVTSFAVSLERFYEFYTYVTCLKHRVNPVVFDDTWKKDSKFSERQYGAYLIAYLMDHKDKKPPSIENVKPKLDRRGIPVWKEFRNNVIHNGYFPTVDEAKAYGDLVFSHINEILQDMKINSKSHIGEAITLHMQKISNLAKGKNADILNMVTICLPTLLSPITDPSPANNFDEAIQLVKSFNYTFKANLHRPN